MPVVVLGSTMGNQANGSTEKNRDGIAAAGFVAPPREALGTDWSRRPHLLNEVPRYS
jgi:hypothetical protein